MASYNSPLFQTVFNPNNYDEKANVINTGDNKFVNYL